MKATKLYRGDTIKLIAPASTFHKDRFIIAKRNLEKLGFKVTHAQSIFNRYGNFAGKDEVRAKDFMDGITDPNVKALLCIRGGFGSAKIISSLDSQLIKKNPKILIGFSDSTFLHIYFQSLGIPSFHGPMLMSSFEKPTRQFLKEFKHIFIDNKPLPVFGDKQTSVLRKGKASGKVVGGNLALVMSTMGTPYEINTKNAILVLEDVDEPPYRIDRMLTQLQMAGKLDELNGLIFGEFKNAIATTKYSLPLIDIIKNITKHYAFPILYNFPVGHTNARNRILPLGIQALINTHDMSLNYQEKALKD